MECRLGRSIGYPKLSTIYYDHMDECHKSSKDCEIIQNFKENAIKNSQRVRFL